MAKLTLEQAAARLKLSTRTLRRRIKEGSLHAALEDGKYFIDATEVDRMAHLARELDTPRMDTARGTATPSRVIVLERMEYDALISRMGFLEGQQKLIEDLRKGKEAELQTAKDQIEDLEGEINRLREMDGWQRFKNWFWGRKD